MRFILFALLTACSSCTIGTYPITPEVAESGTYELFNDMGQGTAWAVDSHHLVTAGHMCEQNSPDVVAISTGGRRFRGKVVFWDQAHSYMSDLCLIQTDYKLPQALNIAPVMSKIGEKVGYVGFPDGRFGLHEGVYLGDTDGTQCNEADYSFSAWTDHGASGSAIYTDRGVWGVLVRIRVECGGLTLPPEAGGVAIPLDVLAGFLNDADVDYTVTPEKIEKLF